MKKLPIHSNDAEPQISIFSHDRRVRRGFFLADILGVLGVAAVIFFGRYC